jgi:flagellar hook-associated protein 3 FlgL
MRVTPGMLTQTLLHNLQGLQSRLNDLSDQLTSGRRVRKPSDDPAGAAIALDIRARQNRLEAQARGRGMATDWLQSTETNLNDIAQTLARVKELSVQASSTLLDQSSRNAIADELDQILDHLVQVGNARIGDRFLFAGLRTTTPPFTRTPGTTTVTYGGTASGVSMRVDAGVVMTVGVPGSSLASVFSAVGGLIDDLRTPGVVIGPARLQAVETAHDAVLALQAQVGAKTNRLEAMEQRAGQDAVALASHLSEIEDTDFTAALLDYQTRQTVYQAALVAGSKLIQPSLLDFLR